VVENILTVEVDKNHLKAVGSTVATVSSGGGRGGTSRNPVHPPPPSQTIPIPQKKKKKAKSGPHVPHYFVFVDTLIGQLGMNIPSRTSIYQSSG
jgi:hypothetical protein